MTGPRDETFDYIVIGAGSAGCVVANRLSADVGRSVLLLEAGPSPSSPWISIPAAVPRLLVPGAYNWPDMTVAAPELGGRKLWIGHGRTLGGSSAINGMVYNRGDPADFSAWQALGCVGWGWDDVLPHFLRIERELEIETPKAQHRSVAAFVDAAIETGMTRTDFAARGQAGAGLFRMSIAKGRRRSAYETFLRPVRRRANLHVRTDAQVDQLLLENNRAIGVVYTCPGGKAVALARGEIIVCAGAIDSPRLLMLSGIGPAAHLKASGLRVVAEMPGVGSNLQDHLMCSVTVTTSEAGSMNRNIHGVRQWWHGLRFLFTRSGPATMGTSSAGGFACIDPVQNRPQIQFSFRPFSAARGNRAAFEVERVPAVTGSVSLLHPASQGTIRLPGPDVRARPVIDPAYLRHPRDVELLVSGMRHMAAIFRSDPMQALVAASDIPGDAGQDDGGIAAYLREKAVSMCHPGGTCRMGSDTQAVVDSRLRVRGVAGLRVADASIMPDLPSGNTNAAAMMIGDKAAMLIREDAMLA